MATDIVGSLFGVTPEGLDAARQQQMREQAMAYAKLTPQEQITYGASLAGQQFGRSIGGLLGAEDPQMKLVQLRSSIMQGTDPTNVESLTSAIQKLQSANDTVGALNLTNILRNLQKTQAETIKVTKEGLTTEQRNAAGIADSLHQRGTPEWTSTYKTELTRLTSKESPKGQIKEVGVAIGTNKPVYLDPNTDQQYIYIEGKDGKQIRQPYFGGVDRTTAKISATATSKGEEKGAEEMYRLDAKRLDEARTASSNALNQAGILQQLLRTPQPISGSGADIRLSALRVFDTVGLTSSNDKEALANSDKFNSLTGERVLSFVKQLGANPSNTDRDFAKTIGPAIQKGQKTNQDLANYLLGRANDIVKEAESMEKHYYENRGSLKGYQSVHLKNLSTGSSALPSVKSMSTDEIKKELAKSQSK